MCAYVCVFWLRVAHDTTTHGVQGRLVGIPCQSKGLLSELRCIDEVIVKVQFAADKVHNDGCPGFE